MQMYTDAALVPLPGHPMVQPVPEPPLPRPPPSSRAAGARHDVGVLGRGRRRADTSPWHRSTTGPTGRWGVTRGWGEATFHNRWGRVGEEGLGLVDFFWMNCHESWWCSPQKCEMWIMWVMIMIGNFDKCDVFVSPNLPRCMRIPQPCSHGVGYVIFGIHMERHETQTLFHGQYKWLFKSLHYI